MNKASQAYAFHQPVGQWLLTAPLEHSTCPYERSLLSFRMRSRTSMPSLNGSGGDNVLWLDIADLSDHCPVMSDVGGLAFAAEVWINLHERMLLQQSLLTWQGPIKTVFLYISPIILFSQSRLSSEHSIWLDEKFFYHHKYVNTLALTHGV